MRIIADIFSGVRFGLGLFFGRDFDPWDMGLEQRWGHDLFIEKRSRPFFAV